MTLKIKMAHILILEMGFKKSFDSHLWNYIGKLKIIRGTDLTDCKNE